MTSFYLPAHGGGDVLTRTDRLLRFNQAKKKKKVSFSLKAPFVSFDGERRFVGVSTEVLAVLLFVVCLITLQDLVLITGGGELMQGGDAHTHTYTHTNSISDVDTLSSHDSSLVFVPRSFHSVYVCLFFDLIMLHPIEFFLFKLLERADFQKTFIVDNLKTESCGFDECDLEKYEARLEVQGEFESKGGFEAKPELWVSGWTGSERVSI